MDCNLGQRQDRIMLAIWGGREVVNRKPSSSFQCSCLRFQGGPRLRFKVSELDEL